MTNHVRLVTEARLLADLNRTEGWNGNDCDRAMRLLNELAALVDQLIAERERERDD